MIDFKEQEAFDEFLIQAYLEENNLTATKDSSGIYYIIEEAGTDGSPSLSNDVIVKYTGYFLNGEIFDQTTAGNTVSFPLDGVIEGWQIAVPLLQKGGKGTFIIPSRLAYGNQVRGNIPPNSVLVFDIELVDFN